MPGIPNIVGEKIGMSRRDIHRLGRDLASSEIDAPVREHPRYLPLIAHKDRLWSYEAIFTEWEESGASDNRAALQTLIFLQLARFGLPPKWSRADKTPYMDGPESYIRKIVHTREASNEAAKNLPYSLDHYIDAIIPSIWQSRDGRERNARIVNAIKKRMARLGQITENALVAGYPEWRSPVIFHQETSLEFVDFRNKTGVIYCKYGTYLDFATREQFHEYIAAASKHEKRQRPVSSQPKRPVLEKITRIGPEYDFTKISARDFMERFAFRGVEFGSWLSQEDRQSNLKWAASAFMDLARILGIDEKAIGRNSLGFSFGARGNGGSQSVAAHYEPAFNVINLTKMNGAGSVAHEWAHFIDNMVLRSKGLGSDTMTWLYGPGSLQGRDLVEERRKNLAKLEEDILARLSLLDWRRPSYAIRVLGNCEDWEKYKCLIRQFRQRVSIGTKPPVKWMMFRI